MEATRASQITPASQSVTQTAQSATPPRAGSSVPASFMRGGPPAVRLGSALPAAVTEIISAPEPGAPLAPALLISLEKNLGANLGNVRVHVGSRPARAAASIAARAFTYGRHIFLGARERATDLALMAHEVAHVVQQRGSPIVQRLAGSGGSTGALEQEADRAATAVQHNQPVQITGSTGGPRIQRQEQSIWQRGASAISQGVEAAGEYVGEQVWALVEEYAPELVPIIRQGVLEWLREKIGQAIESVFNTLMTPVREVTGFIGTLTTHFNNLMTWMREAASQIARGDCSAIAQAAEKIQQVVSGLAAPIIDRIKSMAERVKGFFTGLWDRFGAPAWDFLRRVGGQAWERIQQFGRWIWEKTARIRDLAARAWRWFKNRLGIGEGPEGQNGLLQWVQEKASAAWELVRPYIERFKRPLMVVAGVLLLLSPAGPFIAIGAVIGGLIVGVRWLRQHFSTPDGVVRQRDLLRGTILPGIMSAVNGVTGFLTRLAGSVSGTLGRVMGGLGEMVGAVAGSILNFAVSLVQWVADRFRELAAWANEKLSGLADWVRSGLERLRTFLQPVFEVLGQIAGVIGNLLQLPMLVVGRLWRIIPACIRNPFVQFLINQILRRIPLVSSIVEIVEVWPRIRQEALSIIRQIFVQGDLSGALLRILRLLLRVLNVPVQLVVAIFEKASSALDLIMANPGRFLRNVLQAVKQGFQLFFSNILRHLLRGLREWFFQQLGAAGITAPDDISFGSIFRLVLQILGISVEHVLERLARRVSPETMARIRAALRFLSGAWEWVSIAITEGPAGLWRKLTQQLSNLWQQVLDGVIGWLTTNIIERVTARLISMLDPTGVMAVVNSLIALYSAIQSAIEYLRPMLEIFNTFLDSVIGIARGAIGPAAGLLESLLGRAIPVAIGFLANQVRLRGLGRRMREILASIRAQVDRGIDWLIDIALRAGTAFLNLGRAAIGAISDWWRARKDFTNNQGESHYLSFSGQGRSATLMMASGAPKSVRGHIRDYEEANPSPSTSDAALLGAAKAKIGEIETLTSTQITGAATPETQTIAPAIDSKLNDLVIIFRQLNITPPNVELSNITYTTEASVTPGYYRAKQVVANRLTKLAGNTRGSSASATAIAAWTQTPSSERNLWIRMHLVSHRLHGPGDAPWNLVIAPTGLNTGEVEPQVERPLQAYTARNLSLSFNVGVSYGHAAPYQDFPSNVTFTWANLANANLPAVPGVPSPGRGSSKSYRIDPPLFLTVPTAQQDLNTANRARVLAMVNGNHFVTNAIMSTRGSGYANPARFLQVMRAYFNGGFNGSFGRVAAALLPRSGEYMINGQKLTASQIQEITDAIT